MQVAIERLVDFNARQRFTGALPHCAIRSERRSILQSETLKVVIGVIDRNRLTAASAKGFEVYVSGARSGRAEPVGGCIPHPGRFIRTTRATVNADGVVFREDRHLQFRTRISGDKQSALKLQVVQAECAAVVVSVSVGEGRQHQFHVRSAGNDYGTFDPMVRQPGECFRIQRLIPCRNG